MKHAQRLAALAAAAGLATSAAAADVQVLTGPLGQPGALVAYDDATGLALAPPAPELQGVQLLPLVLNGQSGQTALLPAGPRWLDEPAGLGRIELPGRGGVLYRFVRHESSGARTYGFLRALPDGTLARLAERPGAGPQQLDDPYLGRAALAPDLRSLLVATTFAAGGDVLEVRLDTGVVRDRTPQLPPLHLRGPSLRIAPQWMVAAADEGVLRGDRAPAARMTRVASIPPAALVTGELVLSPSGTWALTTLGSDATHLDAWSFGPTGDATRMNAAPAELTGAGYLPDAPHGPFLAVSDDGQWAGWTSVLVGKHELFMRERPAQATPVETQVTADAYFADTLEEIGVLGIFSPGELTAAVGEVAPLAEGGIENLDFFRVRVDATGAPVLENATQTSGQTAAPFLATPQLSPSHLRWVPEANAYVMFDDLGSGDGRLVSVTPGVTGVQLLAAGLKEITFLERVGARLVIGVRLSTGQRQHQVLTLPVDLSSAPALLVDGGNDAFLEPVTSDPRWLAFQEVPDVGVRRLHRVRLADGLHQVFPVAADEFGSPVAVTASGALAFSFVVAGTPRLVAWPTGGAAPVLLRVPGGFGAVLPGH